VTSLGRWTDEARRILDHIESTQFDAIEAVSQLCARAIGSGGLVHLFGSGHSRIPVEEMFPRYGSYAGFHPMVELSMTFHTEIVGTNSQPAAMFIERVSGLAEVILDGFQFGPHDVMVVFSASGRSAVPVEIAIGARRRGLPVVAVTSIAESTAVEATHSDGRLLDNADIVIDIGTPPGDALVSVDGLDVPVGPGSTIANTAIVNEVKVRTAELLVEMGEVPHVLTASSVVGAEESRRRFAEAYAEHGRRLGRIIGSRESGD
jgi:uncharacterized phosphosugar-binding protein